jgi:esterase/lipase superfamily enzyme
MVGCASVRATPPLAVAPVDTVWYVSTRARDNGADTDRLADSAEVGLAIMRPRNADPRTGRIDPAVQDSVVLSWAEFIGHLQRRLTASAAGNAGVPWLVHGYGTSLRECWQGASNAQVRARSSTPWVAFCWPSNGTGVSLPGREGLLSRSYRLDSARAESSRPAFATATRALLDVVGGDRLVLVAHSLGALLVAESLAADTALRTALRAQRLRAIAFVAPDVDRARFGDVLLPAVATLTRRTVVYVSSSDRALSFARRVTGSDRAGLSNSTPAPWPGTETVDITHATTSAGWFHRTLGTRHSLRRASGLIFDIAQVVAAGHAADCRAVVGTGVRDDTGSWRLGGAPLPDPDATIHCSPFVPRDPP